MRYYIAFFGLLFLVLRSMATQPADCVRFTLKTLDGREQWTTVACGKEVDDVRALDGVAFVIVDEQVIAATADERGTTGQMASDAAQLAATGQPTGEHCFRFTLRLLTGGPTWVEEACDEEAQKIWDRRDVEFILVEEMGA
jgi:hypothetical protein